jgi:hypothetical protein
VAQMLNHLLTGSGRRYDDLMNKQQKVQVSDTTMMPKVIQPVTKKIYQRIYETSLYN